jgi:AraC-like DNA-binding protein
MAKTDSEYGMTGMTKVQFRMLRCGIADVEAVESDTCHVFPRHTHQQFGIGVITRGAQKSHSGRGMVEAGCGDTITVNPAEVHDGAPIGDAGRSWKMLYFAPSLIARATRDVSSGNTKTYEFSQPVIRDTRVSDLFRELFATVTSPTKEEAAFHGEELLLILVPAIMGDQVGFERTHSIPKGVFKAKELVDDNPVVPITLFDLARESGLSQFQVLRGFVRLTGLTPHAYIVQCRINAARRMIARGTRLAETALACGFADQSHMTRIFVRKYGISPAAYANAVN